MYEYPKGSKWKKLKRFVDLQKLHDEYQPDKILFCTDDYDDFDRSDTVPCGAELIFPNYELTFDRLHVDMTNGTTYLISKNGGNCVSFHLVKEICYKIDTMGNPIIRIRCVFDTTRKTYHFGLIKGEIYRS